MLFPISWGLKHFSSIACSAGILEYLLSSLAPDEIISHVCLIFWKCRICNIPRKVLQCMSLCCVLLSVQAVARNLVFSFPPECTYIFFTLIVFSCTILITSLNISSISRVNSSHGIRKTSQEQTTHELKSQKLSRLFLRLLVCSNIRLGPVNVYDRDIHYIVDKTNWQIPPFKCFWIYLFPSLDLVYSSSIYLWCRR